MLSYSCDGSFKRQHFSLNSFYSSSEIWRRKHVTHRNPTLVFVGSSAPAQPRCTLVNDPSVCFHYNAWWKSIICSLRRLNRSLSALHVSATHGGNCCDRTDLVLKTWRDQVQSMEFFMLKSSSKLLLPTNMVLHCFCFLHQEVKDSKVGILVCKCRHCIVSS